MYVVKNKDIKEVLKACVDKLEKRTIERRKGEERVIQTMRK